MPAPLFALAALFRPGRPLSITPVADNAARVDLTRQDDPLHDEIARLRAELADARLDSLSTLARGVADDLDRILRPIEMSIGVLDEELADAESRRALGVLHDSIARGTSLAAQLRTFGAGLDTSAPAVDLEPLLADLRRVVASTFPRSIELVVETVAGVGRVAGDSARLAELLLNLCLNARDAMPAGGRLLLRAEPAALDETAAASMPGARPGRYVAITVADTGSRLAGEARARINDPYFGFLSVQTDAGRGTVARVFVPVAVPGDPQSRPPAIDGQGELILLVGFDGSVQSIASHVLTAHGYRVTAATTGADAVAAFANHSVPIAAAVVDLPSRDVDGTAMIRALQTVSPAVKIIAATALDATTAAFGAACDVHGLLPKPLHTESLLFVLRRVLDR
jgi:two-component system, cell cycle sensor histidine kinase and response regulator CckA